MLSLMLKDQNNITKLLYSDYKDNQLIYHGVKLVNNSAYDIGQQIFQEVYDLIKIKPHHKFLYNYREYKVYYDKNNDIKHFIRDGREDFFMFYIFNGIDATLYEDNNKRLKKHQSLKEFIIDGIRINIALSFLLTIVTISPYYLGNSTISLPNNIKYQHTETIAYIDTLSTNEAIDMIQSSPYLKEKEKEFLSNEKLLNDVLPLYQGTEMSYIIRERLKDIKIIYKKLDDGVAGCYCGDNIIYLDERYKDVDYNDLEKGKHKLSIMAHEFVHLLQSIDCPKYLKEATAELISNEYFFESSSCNSCLNATENLMLLIETIGPKDIWNFTFSGDNTEFNKYLDKYLGETDAKELIKELNMSPAHSKHNNDKIKSLLEKMYKNMYGIEMRDNPYIYNKLGKYIDKKHYFYQYKNYQDIEGYSYEDSAKLGIVKDKKQYLFEKELTKEDYYNMKITSGGSFGQEEWESLTIDYDFCYSNDYMYKGNKINYCSHHGDNGIKINYGNDDYIIISVEEALDAKIIKNVHYKYLYYTTNPNSKKMSDMTNDGTYYHIYVINNKEYTKMTDNHNLMFDKLYSKKNIDVYKYIPSIKDRFPDQIIMHEDNNKILSN